MINSNFFKLFLASAASNLGDGIALIAFPWLASSITRDPLLIALVPLFAKAPWLFFSLPAGVIIDRFDRRKLIFIADVLRVLLTLLVFATVFFGPQLASPEALASGAAQQPDNALVLISIVYAASLLLGIAEVLRDSAAQTILPSLVAKNQLENANSKLATVELVMNSLAGPPLAGFLIALALAGAFAANVGIFAFSTMMVFWIAGNFVAPKEEMAASTHWFQDLKDGVSWLWQHILLRDLAIMLGIVNASYMMSLATQVLFAQEILNLDPQGFGLLLTGAAFGGIVGGVLTPHISKRIKPGTLLAISLVLFGAENIVFGLTRNPFVAWGALFTGAMAGVIWNVVTVSFRQEIIPDRLLGRVNSVYRFFSWGLMPVGSVLGGLLVVFVEGLGSRDLALRSPFLLAGGIMLLFVIFCLWRLTNAKFDAARAGAKTAPVPQS